MNETIPNTNSLNGEIKSDSTAIEQENHIPKLNFKDSGRIKIEDKIIDGDRDKDDYAVFSEKELKYKLFIRLGARKIKFKDVQFSQSFFENCYFRDCVFQNCNFDGCKFSNSNLTGSSFPGSTFQYCNFEKTFLDNDILINNCPPFDNIRSKFARSLRLNFSSIGDSDSANKAMKIELQATETHLLKSWLSREEYFRKKYRGFNRINHFLKWLYFIIQDLIWGNGESPKKLFRAGLSLWIIMTIIDVFYFKDINLISNYIYSFLSAPAIFFGIEKPVLYSTLYLSFIAMIRLIGFGLFMSIIIKKFNKR